MCTEAKPGRHRCSHWLDTNDLVTNCKLQDSNTVPSKLPKSLNPQVLPNQPMDRCLMLKPPNLLNSASFCHKKTASFRHFSSLSTFLVKPTQNYIRSFVRSFVLRLKPQFESQNSLLLRAFHCIAFASHIKMQHVIKCKTCRQSNELKELR